MTIINSGDNNTVVINGRASSAVYRADMSGDKVMLKNIYTGGVEVQDNYGSLVIDGSTPTSSVEAVELLSAFVGNFKTPGSGSGPGVNWFGSLSKHTDIKSLDTPTITIVDPENPSETVVKTLATLDNIPAPSPTVDLDVSSMFKANVELTHFAARMVQYPGKLPFIRIFCEDTSGEDNTLTLTVSRGFGSFIDHTGQRAIAQHYIDENGAVAHDTITITPETQSTESVITVSPNLHEFNITYWVGSIDDSVSSYWVDLSGVYHPFTADKTPFNVFFLDALATSVVIEGEIVSLGNIKYLMFGDDYAAETELGPGFCYNLHNCDEVNISRLTNINSISDRAFLSSGIKKLDLSKNINIASMSSSVCSYCPYLKDINLGSLNVNNIDFPGSTTAFYRIPNTPDCILRGDSLEVLDAFTNLLGVKFLNWTVVINS